MINYRNHAITVPETITLNEKDNDLLPVEAPVYDVESYSDQLVHHFQNLREKLTLETALRNSLIHLLLLLHKLQLHMELNLELISRGIIGPINFHSQHLETILQR